MKYIISIFLLCGCSQWLTASTDRDTVPQTQSIGHLSTTWDDFIQPSPSDQVPLIHPPTPSETGETNLSFPIKLPEARQGHHPDLNITYNNEAGSTWLGTGWDLSLSSFTLDTRWGVPVYDPGVESEIYLYNGQQLGPVFHRTQVYTREAERVFTLRIDGPRQRIIRHGDSPKNYWWEVRDTDGRITYYGGTPEIGAHPDYHIATDDNNITEWLVAQSKDIHDNLIQYTYQKKTTDDGLYAYPLTITYNGYQSSPGDYKVHFALSEYDRQDTDIDCRSGMIRVLADVLGGIIISYKNQSIRSYRLTYESGPFGKTLLKAIEEYDQDSEPFYKYSFEYHDDVTNEDGQYELWSERRTWSVPKDDIQVNPVSATNAADFIESPTIIGGATTSNRGAALSVTIGPVVGNPASKENTIGANGGGSTSNGTGVITLVDINGDGKPDKVWKEDNMLYYRPNQHSDNSSAPDFGEKHQIVGVNDFSKSNTITWHIGGELNVGIGVAAVYVGYSHEESNTKIQTYFADFNGDELIDIAHNGKVYFNTLDADGHPTFSRNAGVSASPIFAGEVPAPAEVDPAEQDAIARSFPLHDVIREWRAPFSGTVAITGAHALLPPTGQAAIEDPNRDGVIVTIQHNSNERYRRRIEADDQTSYVPTNVNAIPVNEGDKIYFRTHSVSNGHGDHVEWDPIITYLGEDTSLTDANGLPYYRYQASKDFLISSQSTQVLPVDGTIQVNADLIKPITSDSIFIRFSGGIVFDTFFSPSQTVAGQIKIDDVAVIGNTPFQVSIYAKSNVAWSAIKFMPTITYTSFADGSPAENDDGSPILSICPIVDYQTYTQVARLGSPFVVPNDGKVEVLALMDLFLSDRKMTFLTLKSKMHPDSIQAVDTTVMMTGDTLHLSMEAMAGDTLYADIHSQLDLAAIVPPIIVDTCLFIMGTDTSEVDCGIYWRRSAPDKSGHHYRGWGQFVYNANDGRGDMPIMLGGLDIDEDGIAGDTSLIDEDSDPSDVEGGNVTVDELFIVMSADPKSSAWRGSDALTFITDSEAASSRNGRQDVDLSDNTTYELGDFPAIILMSKSISDAVSGGGEVGSVGAGGGVTPGRSFSIADLTDMNGDRYPDHLYRDRIEYTNHQGGLSDRRYMHSWGIHEAGSRAVGGGIGGSDPQTSAKSSGEGIGTASNKRTTRQRAKGKSKLSGSRNAFGSSRGSVGISGNYTRDKDWTKHTFMDINGDGLEDKVWDNGDVALNLGYSFAPVRSWGFTDLVGGSANDWGGGVGISYMNGSFLAGFSASRTDSQLEFGFADINDDALLDKILSTDPLVVKFNTGNGFGAATTIANSEKIDAGYSIGESLNGAATVCFPVFLIRVCINPSTSIGQGTSSVGTALTDINGDGYPDILQAQTDDSHLSVQESVIGQTNMLKSIHYPMHGQLDITYQAVGNTREMPFSKWVISGYTVTDGVSGDGIDAYQHAFAYKDPVYDRHERQFLGFSQTEDQYLDADGATPSRTIKTVYHNDNIYLQGRIREESIIGRSDSILQTTYYGYSVRDINSLETLPSSALESDLTSAWVTLDHKTVSTIEGSEDLRLDRQYAYQYDTYGNILSEIDQDGAGNKREMVYTYSYDLDRYLVDRPLTEITYGDGMVYRHTETDRDVKGNATQVREKVDETGRMRRTDLTYDVYGNVISMIKPANHKGQRLTYTRTYDDDQHQYMIEETDSYGYTESTTYEYLHNQVTSSTDKNGQVTYYEIDAKGRPASVRYPAEVRDDIPWSILFEYHHDAPVGYAVAHHYDPYHEEPLDLIQFEDGLHRPIQTKVTASIYDNGTSQTRFIVSGTEIFDALGRKVRSHFPVLEDISTPFTLNTQTDPVSTSVSYDALDRPITVIDPYGGTTQFAYGLDYTPQGQLALTTHETNTLNNTSHHYYNTRGQMLSKRIDGPQGDIWTRYDYDGISQVAHIYDAYDNETTYGYDMLGRRISVKVPDAGTTRLTYDDADNLTHRTTATIRDVVSEDAAISYHYDHERLVQIDYPKYFQNKVQIHYGSPQDSFNRAGRIWLQEDATGGIEYFFDINGRPTKEIRTVMVNRSQIFTYVSEASYDTWGRVREYVYPDGERLTYQYNKGGLIKSMSGQKGPHVTQYLREAGYDRFSDRIFVHYGNDTKDLYQYDDKGRMTRRSILLADGSTASDVIYTYDATDNVISRKDNAQADMMLGGVYEETYTYDQLKRMTAATGQWKGHMQERDYTIDFAYDDIDNLTAKDQVSFVDGDLQLLTSRSFDYTYDHATQPTRPSQVGGKDFVYDANGNLIRSSSEAIFDYDQNVFDEENRLLGTSNNGYISRYTYDAFGRRILKSHGESQGVFINGAPAGFIEHKTNFRIDVSPYFTATEHEYRKHYFIDDMRILSKIGTGVFQTPIASVPPITAGGLDYKSRIQQYEYDILNYYAELDVPPGPPTLLAYLGQPEINGTSLPATEAAHPYTTPPLHWPTVSPPDTTGPPGAPIVFDTIMMTNANVNAGYNFSSGNITQEVEQFYFHYDHTASTYFVTNLVGHPRQYSLYLPSGERWIHQRTTTDSTSYGFSGLLYDTETGMYDLGNIYYDPVTNVEQSVDPVLQNFGQATFLKRHEGSFYYDYAEDVDDNDEIFDNEILNSEKPDPFLPHTPPNAYRDEGVKTENYINEFGNNLLSYEAVTDLLGGKDIGWDQLDIDFDHPFGAEIKALVPHLDRNLSEAEFRVLVNEIIVEPRKNALRRKIKQEKAQKQSGQKKKVPIKRRVRF